MQAGSVYLFFVCMCVCYHAVLWVSFHVSGHNSVCAVYMRANRCMCTVSRSHLDPLKACQLPGVRLKAVGQLSTLIFNQTALSDGVKTAVI